MDEILSQLPGKTFEFRQESNSNSSGHSAPTRPMDGHAVNLLEKNAAGTYPASAPPPSSAPSSSPSSSTSPRKKPLTLVYFIGGVTFAEISALRFLSAREDHDRDYI